MSPTSAKREIATKSRCELESPATNREFFHDSKYSFIVGTIVTSAVKASASVGCQAWVATNNSPAVVCIFRVDASSTLASGKLSPKSTVLLPSRSADTFATVKSGNVPHKVLSVTPNRLPGWAIVRPSANVKSYGATLSPPSAPDEPASKITSKSVKVGTPATMPSICS